MGVFESEIDSQLINTHHSHSIGMIPNLRSGRQTDRSSDFNWPPYFKPSHAAIHSQRARRAKRRSVRRDKRSSGEPVVARGVAVHIINAIERPRPGHVRARHCVICMVINAVQMHAMTCTLFHAASRHVCTHIVDTLCPAFAWCFCC